MFFQDKQQKKKIFFFLWWLNLLLRWSKSNKLFSWVWVSIMWMLICCTNDVAIPVELVLRTVLQLCFLLGFGSNWISDRQLFRSCQLFSHGSLLLFLCDGRSLHTMAGWGRCQSHKDHCQKLQMWGYGWGASCPTVSCDRTSLAEAPAKEDCQAKF